MIPICHVLSVDRVTRFTANTRLAVQGNFLKTEQENWQTSWLTEFIQDEALEKYAIEIAGTDELIVLSVYRNMSDGICGIH